MLVVPLLAQLITLSALAGR